MNKKTIESEWEILTSLLPHDWRDLARSTGALQRSRQIRDPDTLLRLILLHVATGLSLRQTSARAKRSGLADLSDVAILKRLRTSGPWLRALAERMFVESPFRYPLNELPAGSRIRIVDATNVTEPGSTGTDWRIHYVLQLPSLECDFFEVTDPKGSETYKRLPVEAGDIILGDRGYCHRAGVASVVDAGGDVVVRLNSTSFPLQTPEGEDIDLLSVLSTLVDQIPGEWPVKFTAAGKLYTGRLCAIRKNEEAAELARKKILRYASKRGRKTLPKTLDLAAYIFVLTTLPAKRISTPDVLELYRARWQVELAFKQIKTLFGAGHVPKYDPESARAWIHAKLLAVLLIERLQSEARFFSPWGFRISTAKPLARVHRSS